MSRAYVWTLAVALSPLVAIALLQAALFGLAPLNLDGDIRATITREFAPMLIAASVGLVAIGIAILTRWLAWRRTAYALDGDRLLIATGWWRRRLILLPLDQHPEHRPHRELRQPLVRHRDPDLRRRRRARFFGPHDSRGAARNRAQTARRLLISVP